MTDLLVVRCVACNRVRGRVIGDATGHRSWLMPTHVAPHGGPQAMKRDAGWPADVVNRKVPQRSIPLDEIVLAADDAGGITGAGHLYDHVTLTPCDCAAYQRATRDELQRWLDTPSQATVRVQPSGSGTVLP